MTIRCLFADGKRCLILKTVIVISFVQGVKTNEDRIRWQSHQNEMRSSKDQFNTESCFQLEFDPHTHTDVKGYIIYNIACDVYSMNTLRTPFSRYGHPLTFESNQLADCQTTRILKSCESFKKQLL